MILTVKELRKHIETNETDDVLTLLLEAVEHLIHGYTNNSFHKYMVDGVIVYPADVKMGVINLLKWELNNRAKVGIASESISRHSVTYVSMSGSDSALGYPKSLIGFLAPYMKARFGQGMNV